MKLYFCGSIEISFCLFKCVGKEAVRFLFTESSHFQRVEGTKKKSPIKKYLSTELAAVEV